MFLLSNFGKQYPCCLTSSAYSMLATWSFGSAYFMLATWSVGSAYCYLVCWFCILHARSVGSAYCYLVCWCQGFSFRMPHLFIGTQGLQMSTGRVGSGESQIRFSLLFLPSESFPYPSQSVFTVYYSCKSHIGVVGKYARVAEVRVFRSMHL